MSTFFQDLPTLYPDEPQMIQELRKEVWAHALGDSDNFDHFVSQVSGHTKSVELPASLPSAVLYGSVA